VNTHKVNLINEDKCFKLSKDNVTNVEAGILFVTQDGVVKEGHPEYFSLYVTFRLHDSRSIKNSI